MWDSANLDRSPQGCIEIWGIDGGRKMRGQAQWYPTSDQKRVRYGAPVVRLHGGKFQGRFFHAFAGTAESRCSRVLRRRCDRCAVLTQQIEEAITDRIRILWEVPRRRTVESSPARSAGSGVSTFFGVAAFFRNMQHPWLCNRAQLQLCRTNAINSRALAPAGFRFAR